MKEEKEYDIYEKVASVIFDLHVEDITKEHRNKTKELLWSWVFSIRTPSDELAEVYKKTMAEMIELRKGE